MWTFILSGQVPTTFHVQGVLTDITNKPLPNGSYEITFRLYTSAVSDIPVWSETHGAVQVQNGVFSVQLGGINPFTIAFDKNYVLGIKTGNQPEMNPRIRLSSTPYSLMANDIMDNRITNQKIQINAVTADKIAPNIISSINGVSNDGGNINILAGNNVSIVPDNINKTVTISAIGNGTGNGNINQLNEGSNISIQNAQGPITTIGLKPNVLLGPGGSLGILNPNGGAVASLSTISQGGYFSLSNSDLINTFGVIGSTIDKQPLLYLNNRLGNQVAEIKADEFSNGLLSVKSVLNNPLVRMGANENTGGLVHVFNQRGNVGIRLTSNTIGDGRFQLFNVNNGQVLDLKTNVNGGGFFGLYNQDGTESVRLTTLNDKTGSINVNNKLGNHAVDIQVNEGNGGFIQLFNEEKTESVRLTTTQNRSGLISVKNSFGNNILRMTTNPFSDGDLELYSVLTNPTVRLTANDNAGGLINVFSKSGTKSGEWTEEDGNGDFKLFNTEGLEKARLQVLNNSGRLYLKNNLNNQVAVLQSSEFSDGELILNSVLTNTTLHLGANENAGGRFRLFGQRNKLSVDITEEDGAGDLKTYNKDTVDIVHIGAEDNDGILSLKNLGGIQSATLKGSIFGGQLKLFDGEVNRRVRAEMHGTPLGGYSVFYNKNNISISYLGVNPDNQEGLLSFTSGKNEFNRTMELGGDKNSQGTVSIFNNDRKKTTFITHNEFKDGLLEINNNAGIKSGYIASYKDGGVIGVTDGKAAGNDRAFIGNGLYGGRYAAFNFNTKLVQDIGVQKSGEGIYRIVNPDDINQSRVETGGTSNKDGYIHTFTNKNQLAVSLTSSADGAGNIANYKEGKIQSLIGASSQGGDLKIYNSTGAVTSQLSHFDDGRGKIEVGRSNGDKVARLTSNTDGSGYISVDNTDKNEVVRITANTGKGGGIGVKNSLTQDIVTISQNQNHGLLLVNNASGVNTSALSNYEDGRGKIEVGGTNGIKTARMTANPDGSGYISVDNTDKNEVVRITANAAKGGGINVRNSGTKDVVNITQTENAGTILVNDANGNNLTQITKNTAGGGFIGLKNQNQKDAVFISSGQTGYGTITTFNDKDKIATTFTQNNLSHGWMQVNGANNDPLVVITGNSDQTGLINVNGTSGKPIAGISDNTITKGGYIYVNDATGKELASMNEHANGAGTVVVNNKSGANLTGLQMNPSGNGGYVYVNNNTAKNVVQLFSISNGNGAIAVNKTDGTNLSGFSSNATTAGGYVYANTSTGKEVVRMTSTTAGTGYMSIDNAAGKTASYVTTSDNGGGYIGVANNTGLDRARLTTTTGGAGYVSISNASGNEIATMSNTGNNGGLIETKSSNGIVMTRVGTSASNTGYISATSSAGNERAYMTSGNFGGEIGVLDNSNRERVRLAASGFMEVTDVDGSYMSIFSSGSQVKQLMVDKFQHPRLELSPGWASVKAPNGVDNSFVGFVGSNPNLGYIGVCNAGIPNSPVEAGMYVNNAGQGVLFADIKNFKIDYPGKSDKEIWYGSLEGPELAAYIRGTGTMVNGKASIHFDDHYAAMANTKTMTVILTPLSSKSKGLAVVKKSREGFEVEELLEGTGNYDFDWEVKCVRKGHEGFEVVRNKESFRPQLPSTDLNVIKQNRNQIAEQKAETMQPIMSPINSSNKD